MSRRINAEEAKVKQRTRVQEVACDRSRCAVFVSIATNDAGYEQRQREKAMQRVRVGPGEIADARRQGATERSGEDRRRGTTSLTRNPGHRYYDWELTAGQFRFVEHPVNLPREKKYEGNTSIQPIRPK